MNILARDSAILFPDQNFQSFSETSLSQVGRVILKEIIQYFRIWLFMDYSMLYKWKYYESEFS